MKTKNLFELEAIVEEILESNKECRSCDMLLYYKYCEKIVTLKKGSFLSTDFLEVFRNKSFREKYNLRGFASVERVRRKIQAKNSEIVDIETREIRQGETGAYIQYALCL